MANSNYQEPIQQKDLDLGKKLHNVNVESEKAVSSDIEQKEAVPMPEKSGETMSETVAETQEEKISEKFEMARKTIGTQPAAPTVNIASDAQSVSQIQEFEKKVEKLIEIAIEKGPEHAIRVAQHLDKGKDPSQADNYTLDEIHDRLMEEELRRQLVEKGLLKEL